MNAANLKKASRKSFAAPPAEQSVLPRQCCPAFLPREGALPGENECWFCQYADFHIKKARPLDVGICDYPNKLKTLKKGYPRKA